VRHLELVRDEPCVDWWEERTGVHAATLACVAAGLDDSLDLAAAEERLDGALLVLPFLGFGSVDVSALVSPGGGVHRHLEDTYYGGGEWLLLTALLGLAEPERGRACLDWVAAHATPNGELPEQSRDHLLAPDMLEPWVRKWGPPASPLLWSHAMYLTLAAALESG
jgi:GH15 family glucan-1,4-alpha-glucosidase